MLVVAVGDLQIGRERNERHLVGVFVNVRQHIGVGAVFVDLALRCAQLGGEQGVIGRLPVGGGNKRLVCV